MFLTSGIEGVRQKCGISVPGSLLPGLSPATQQQQCRLPKPFLACAPSSQTRLHGHPAYQPHWPVHNTDTIAHLCIPRTLPLLLLLLQASPPSACARTVARMSTTCSPSLAVASRALRAGPLARRLPTTAASHRLTERPHPLPLLMTRCKEAGAALWHNHMTAKAKGFALVACETMTGSGVGDVGRLRGVHVGWLVRFLRQSDAVKMVVLQQQCRGCSSALLLCHMHLHGGAAFVSTPRPL